MFCLVSSALKIQKRPADGRSTTFFSRSKSWLCFLPSKSLMKGVHVWVALFYSENGNAQGRCRRCFLLFSQNQPRPLSRFCSKRRNVKSMFYLLQFSQKQYERHQNVLWLFFSFFFSKAQSCLLTLCSKSGKDMDYVWSAFSS